MMKKTLLSIALILLSASPALSHGINLHVHEEGGRIHAEGYYLDGRPCADCLLVVIEEETGRTLLSGKTDNKGMYVFEEPGHGHDIMLELTDKTGHKARHELHDDPEYHEGEDVHGHLHAETGHEEDAGLAHGLEELLDEKLGPIRDEVSALRKTAERPGLTEVLGGLGYIFGLFGVWALMRTGKNR